MQEITDVRRENEVGKSQKVIGPEDEDEDEDEADGSVSVSVSASVAVAVADRNSVANRWPQQETMALLGLRSEMALAFRDSASKAPLWDVISRRMVELGYQRSAKKCKEKFENIYKYHQRIKNCSYPRTNRKTYRFFDQLEALDHNQISFQTSASGPVDSHVKNTTYVVSPISIHSQCVPQMAMPTSVNFDSFTISTSTSSSSGNESEGAWTKKRKWADHLVIFLKSVYEKQEALQNKFLETLDKHERERQAREKVWRMREMDIIKREQELLMQERSISVAKDAAIAFLQKVLGQGNFTGTCGPILDNLSREMSILCRKEKDNNGEASSSRWPKEEVEALINIKTHMKCEYQRAGPKGPMWEEISIAMKNFGYDRNAKRCKEKWENINKYYRRVKDGNMQGHSDSKTCPYFHLLDQLHNMKAMRLDNSPENSGSNLRPEELLLNMMNHHSRQQQQNQVVLQQDGGETVLHNHKPNNDEEVGNGDVEGDYQVVAHRSHNPLPNVIE